MRQVWTVVDRVALALAGLVLLCAGAALAVWAAGSWPGAPDELDLGVLRQLPTRPEWPWALAAGGAVAIVAGLWSLTGHLGRQRVRQLTLPRGDLPGRLRLDLRAVADAAAERLRSTPDIAAAQSRVVVDRRSTVLELALWCDPSVDLVSVGRSVDRVVRQLAAMLPSGAVEVRVLVEARGRTATEPRVR